MKALGQAQPGKQTVGARGGRFAHVDSITSIRPSPHCTAAAIMPRMNPLLRCLFALVMLAALATPHAHAQREFRPVDEAVTQPDFFSFRAQLLSTLARRDTLALLEVVDKNIKNSFGGNDGINEFKKTWALHKRDSRLWEVLATVLALGGSFTGDAAFNAPYVFSRWPADVDSFANVAVVGSDVRVRASASRNAESIGTLSFAIVERAAPNAAGSAWVAVRLPGGQRGFVDKRFVRGPVDYRAIFTKADGKWMLSALVAGD